ncbi:MAG: hypothetical protein M3334_13820, partial [Actinomycetota bacterium]|nr:hypothetical protein [Actinomycetota bacterium]
RELHSQPRREQDVSAFSDGEVFSARAPRPAPPRDRSIEDAVLELRVPGGVAERAPKRIQIQGPTGEGAST